MNILNKIIKELEKELEDNFSINRAEALLEQIIGLNDPNCIELLIPLLNDNFKYDEYMFSIIHAIEKFEDSIYVEKLLTCIPDFINKSPRWASIIHVRILNSNETLIAYIKQIRETATPVQRDTIKRLLESINSVSPNLFKKTIVLLAAL